MKDQVVEKTELIISALKYAHDNNLDINNHENVKKILEALDPEHKEDVDEFMELLNNSEAFMDLTAREKKPKLPN